jgi:PadR family transcriptional regulator, regulatory protein AphA
MSLKHVLLGFLTQGPESGYSLRKRFFQPGKPRLSQVYRTLKEMASEGLVTSTREQQEKRPARNLFGLTRKGKAEFQRWMAGAWKVAPVKERLVLKLSFASQGKKQAIVAGMDTFIKAKREELAYYGTEAREHIERAAQGRDELDRFYWELVLDFLVRRCKAELEWAEVAMEKIVNGGTPAAAVAVDTREGKGRKNERTRPSGRKDG